MSPQSFEMVRHIYESGLLLSRAATASSPPPFDRRAANQAARIVRWCVDSLRPQRKAEAMCLTPQPGGFERWTVLFSLRSASADEAAGSRHPAGEAPHSVGEACRPDDDSGPAAGRASCFGF